MFFFCQPISFSLTLYFSVIRNKGMRFISQKKGWNRRWRYPKGNKRI